MREKSSRLPVHEGVSREATCSPLQTGFRKCSHWLSLAVGTPAAFLAALLCIICWAVLGPLFHFSDTWQLVVNTATTIITFLMVFLIQNTQNRDTKAIHLKLDELLRGVSGARTSLVSLESLSDEELDRLQDQFERMRRKWRADNGWPTVPIKPRTPPSALGEHV